MRAVIASIERAAPPSASPAGRLLVRLRHEDPVKALEEDIAAYQARVRAALEDPRSRAAELRRLYVLTIERRTAVLRHPLLGHLDETQGLLFPVR